MSHVVEWNMMESASMPSLYKWTLFSVDNKYEVLKMLNIKMRYLSH